LNDIYWEEFVPNKDRLTFLRHKERKFGRGCLTLWHSQQEHLLSELEAKLAPFEQMLVDKPYLLEARPRFVDFDLFGVLGNFLFSGHYRIPAAHTALDAWYDRMKRLKLSLSAREKLHT
jgi:glutathione S-transferase